MTSAELATYRCIGPICFTKRSGGASQIIFMLKDYLSKTGRGWTLLERRQEDLFEQAQRPLGDPRHVLHILGGGLRTSVTEAISEGIVVISPRLSEGRGRCGCGLDSELRHRKC